MTPKRIKSVLSLLLFLFIQILAAQVTITIPTSNAHISLVGNNAEWRKPLGTYFGYERSALIFRHSEIGQYGQINSISFFCDTSIHNPGSTVAKVYMAEQTDSVFTQSSTVVTEETGAQLVYSDTISSSSFVVGQWVTLVFSTPFVHATSRPVKVIIETNTTGTGNENTLSKSFYHNTTPGFFTFQYWSSDNTPPVNAGIRSVNRPNVQFNITALSACSGVPAAGMAMSSVDTTCSQVSLSLIGNTTATGITYQWQDSISGGPWTSISYANYSTLNASITADSWFRCIVKCGVQKDTSSVQAVVLRNYLLCICNSNLGGGCSAGGAIDSVAIPTTNLVTSHTGCSTTGYIQYPATGTSYAQLASGQSYNLHTRFNGNVIASVWIDYNQNGQFDKTEFTRICTIAKIDSDYVTTLNVPVAAKTGLTIMRIRSRDAGNANDSLDACTNFGSGETEDYFIGINYNVGIAQQLKEVKTLNIFPNPASNTLYITGNFIANQQITLELYSITGALISAAENIYSGKPISVDVTNSESGIYFLKVSGKDFSIVKKVSINR